MKTLAACIALLLSIACDVPAGPVWILPTGQVLRLTISIDNDAWHLSFKPDGSAALGFSNSFCDFDKLARGTLPPLAEVLGQLTPHLLNTKGTTGACVTIERGEAITLPQYPDAAGERYIRDLFQQAFAKARFSDPKRIEELLKKYPVD